MSEKEKLEYFVHLISCLKHYHERMLMGGSGCERTACVNRDSIGKCPAVAFTDSYHEALEKCIELLQVEIGKL